MLAAKEEIRIEQAVVHIMDSSLGVPVPLRKRHRFFNC